MMDVRELFIRRQLDIFKDVEAAFDRVNARGKEELRRIAVHEAGHAVVAYHHRFQVSMIDMSQLYLDPDSDRIYDAAAIFFWPWPLIDSSPPEIVSQRNEINACVQVAGQMAEQVLTPELIDEEENGWAGDEHLYAVSLKIAKAYDPNFEPDAFRARVTTQAAHILSENKNTLAMVALNAMENIVWGGESLQRDLRAIKRRRVSRIDFVHGRRP